MSQKSPAMPPGPTEPVSSTGRVPAAHAVPGAAAPAPVAPVAPASAAAPVEPAAAVQAASATGLVQELAGRLRRGEINTAQAVGALIDDVVRGNLTGAEGQAAEVLSAELRAALGAHVEEDPFLRARVRRLGKHQDG